MSARIQHLLSAPSKQLFLLSCLFFARVDMWQNQTNCGYQRVPLAPEASIVGGQFAQDGEWPWIASILELGVPVCGGTLITPDWILTAAHCIQILNDGSAYSAIMGTNSLSTFAPTMQHIYATEIFLHPEYRLDNTDYDIALMRLSEPANLTDYVTTACLPRRGMEDLFPPGLPVTLAGWGTLFQGGRQVDQLREVTVPIVNLTVCRKAYIPFPISDNMLCTGYEEGGKDSCQGDSGGPTVMKIEDRWWLIGVIIGGVGCAVPRYRGVSSNTIAYQDWINPIFEGGEPTKKVVECGPDEFLCQDGWCAPYFTKCDGYPDCRLETDEAYCDGVLKLFDPFFYQRVANRNTTITVEARNLDECARQCINADLSCGVAEFYIDESVETNGDEPTYKCTIAGVDEEMIEIPLSVGKQLDFIQIIRKKNVSVGDHPVFSTNTDVVLTPSYVLGDTGMMSPILKWTVSLPDITFNMLIFKTLAVKGQIDCQNCSSFALLSVMGGGNTTADEGNVGLSRCLGDFVVGESFSIEAAEVFISLYAPDITNVGFMLEYHAIWHCNQTFTAAPGTLSSPRFYLPNQLYPRNVECHYSITAPADKIVVLHMDSYIIEPDAEEGACDFDSLNIYDGNSTDSTRIGFLCGYSDGPVSFHSNENSLYLIFSSDESNELPGFAASFSFADRQTTTENMTTSPSTSTPASPSHSSTMPPVTCSNGRLTFKIAFIIVLILLLVLVIVFVVVAYRMRKRIAAMKKSLEQFRKENMNNLL